MNVRSRCSKNGYMLTESSSPSVELARPRGLSAAVVQGRLAVGNKPVRRIDRSGSHARAPKPGWSSLRDNYHARGSSAGLGQARFVLVKGAMLATNSTQQPRLTENTAPPFAAQYGCERPEPSR